jgi:hypothetical protein
MLEMLRNVLDMLHKVPVYKERMDAIYRKRVLEGHIRRLSIFEALSDVEYSKLQDRIELIEVPTGDLVDEEFDESDAFYVIRSGLVKVVANAWTKVRATEFTNPEQWTGLADEILTPSDDELTGKVTAALSPAAREAAGKIVEAKPASPSDRSALLKGLNELIVKGSLHQQLGMTSTDVATAVNSPALRLAMNDFPDNPKEWSELERCTFHRLLLEHVFANLPERAATAGPETKSSGPNSRSGPLAIRMREPILRPFTPRRIRRSD